MRTRIEVAQNPVNEMVRRLISTLSWVILLAGTRRIIDMQIHSVGIDLGKTTFHLVALSAAGKVLLRKKFTQRQLTTFTANMQISLIGMEACSGAPLPWPSAATAGP
jgi:hypothetical protein